MGGHADEVETSIHLALQPDLVRMDLASADLGRAGAGGYPGYRPGVFSRDPSDAGCSETGHVGEPTLATPEKGRAILRILTRGWLEALRGLGEAAPGSPS